MTTWRKCKMCGKIILMSFNNFKGYPSWKDLFKEEELCKCENKNLNIALSIN